jgi:hypothetical protein
MEKVGAEESYMNLCGQLYKTKFEWFIPNDDNRINDGFDLRDEFSALSSLEINEIDNDVSYSDISVLEVLIALCYRVSYDSTLSVNDCFWEFIHNLDLQKYTDNHYSKSSYNQIHRKVHRFINREYLPDGTGGLFPLKNPKENQQNVELWFQMSAYLIENDLIT